MTIMASPRWRASASTARSAPSPRGWSGADFDRPYTGGGFSVARDGSVALAGGSATRPPDVVLVRGGQRRQLTRLNAELLDTKRLGEVRHIAGRLLGRPAPDRRLADPAARTTSRGSVTR